MHILIGLTIAVALLYFWPLAHWFARVLVFLTITFFLGFLLAMLLPALPATPKAEFNILGFLLGGIIGWLFGSLPTYYWRCQLRRLYEASR